MANRFLSRFMRSKAIARHAHSQGGSFFLRATTPDEGRMKREVGDLTGANVVMSPIQWIQRSFGEAEFIVENISGDEPEVIANHALTGLLNNPNPFYSGDHLWAATIFSLLTSGNGYWVIVRAVSGKVMELWYVPHWLISPKWPQDGSMFLSHYEYRPGGRTIRLDPDDVVHFRIGINPSNTREGMSPLSALLREVWTDMEASMFVSAILQNGGVPGVVFSPADKEVSLGTEELESIKQYLATQFSRGQRGKPLVTSGPTRVEQFGFNPSELDLSSTRNLSEERVCAALGIPAAVVGFGTGVQQTKVGATLMELRKLAWMNGIIPLQSTFAGEINRSLLSLFNDSSSVSARFDNENVKALQEDATAKENRILDRVKAGIMTVEAAQKELGMVPDPGQNFFLRPISMIEVPAIGVDREEAPEPDVGETPKSGHKTKKNGHTPLEHRISEDAPLVRNPPKQLIQLLLRLDREQGVFVEVFEKRLHKFFVSLGEKAEEVTKDLLSKKAVSEDALDAELIFEGMTMKDAVNSFRTHFQQHYLEVGKAAYDAVSESMGLATGLPDAIGRRIADTGGTRSGLIDLEDQTRKALFRSISEGRAEGLAGDNLARSIRDGVEKGPWSSSKVRSQVIARTETKFAQNASTMLRAEQVDGVEQMMVFDARLGSTDEICEALNGRLVSIDEARQLAADEHPNGTRSFTPVSPALISEMEIS